MNYFIADVIVVTECTRDNGGAWTSLRGDSIFHHL